MSAIIIDGKNTSNQIREELKQRCQGIVQKGVTPGLAVVLVGEDPASQIYVRNKIKACQQIGIQSFVSRLPDETTQSELLHLIEQLNADQAVHGILVQLPLPAHIDERAILRAIDADKDVDGFHATNAGKLFLGEPAMTACTPMGCLELLKRYNIPLSGANAVVIGRSNTVGKPMAMLLLKENCTVTLCHSKTKDIKDIVSRADVVVAALGRARFVTADMIKPGAAVVDVGINRMPDGKVVGDVDFEPVSEIAGYITPVPGGVGPMTITMLMRNTLEAAEYAL